MIRRRSFAIGIALFSALASSSGCGANASRDTEEAPVGASEPAGAAVDTPSSNDTAPASSPPSDPPNATAPASAGFAQAPPLKAGRVAIGVKNGCASPLWIHAAGANETLGPDDAKLSPGQVRWYDAPQEWPAARITAFGDGPRARELDKVEMTFTNRNNNVVLNYNITYVDWVGLPVSMESVGTGGDCKPVGCWARRSDIAPSCPNGLFDGARCVAARTYCLDPTNRGKDYCRGVDAEVARCARTKPGCGGAAGSASPEVFACSGPFFSTSPKWCAALNRGMLDDPDNTNQSLYYTRGPYNSYSKWVHQICPGIYAFPYDDYPSNAGQSGFHSCEHGRELHVTFCPSG